MNENRTGTWRTVFFVLIVSGLFLMTRPGGDASLLFRVGIILFGVVGLVVTSRRK